MAGGTTEVKRSHEGVSRYIVGTDGHYNDRVEFFCKDDEAAKRRARALVDGYAVVLWRETSLIAEYTPDRRNPAGRSAVP
jgi:hypothetical protein